MTFLNKLKISRYFQVFHDHVKEFLEEMNTFIQQGCIQLIKSDSNILFLNSEKNMSQVPKKKIKQFFNIDNNKKCFLSIKSYLNDFWRIMWHWRPE